MTLQVSNLKRTILGISVAIILVLFIGYGINTFYPAPEYEDICEEKFTRPIPIAKENVESCDLIFKANQQFEDACMQRDAVVRYETDENGCQVATECDMCNKEYRDTREIYNRNVFFMAVIAGLIAVILGGAVLHLESVSSGIMGGGVLSIIYGTLRYWGDLADVGRFIILGIVLAVLIWIGYKKFGK